MFKISEVVSKPVFSIYEGARVGTVSNFILDISKKKILGFCFVDEEMEFSVGFIASKDIFSLSEALIVKNLGLTSPLSLDEQTIMNQPAISVSGEDLGKISDIFFDEKFNVLSFQTTKKIVLPAASLVRMGRDAVFFNTLEKKFVVSKVKPREKIEIKDLPEIKVSILTESIPIISSNYSQESFATENKIEGEKQFKTRTEIQFPKKVGPSSEIIGKTANKTIVGLNGEVIVKDMQIITAEIYEKAQKHGVLFQLENAVS